MSNVEIVKGAYEALALGDVPGILADGSRDRVVRGRGQSVQA
jgi:ketosteroid isomerase-like protein